MWEGEKEFNTYLTTWATTNFEEIDVTSMEDKVQRFSKLCFKLDRNLPRNKKVPAFSDAVNDYKNLLPVIQALRNPSMKPRHWDKVQELIGQPIIRDESFTLQKILDLKAPDYKVGR